MKLLICLTRFPYPLTKGDKLRAFNQIKELSVNNDISLFCLVNKQPKQEDIDTVNKYCNKIYLKKLTKIGILFSLLKSLFTKLPFQVALFTTFFAKRSFLKYFNKIQPDFAYFQFVRSAEYAKVIKKKCKNSNTGLALDFQDCLSMNMFRRSQVSNPILKFLLLQETKRLRLYEDSMFDIFDVTTIITKQDKNSICSNRRKEIKVVENGIDEKFFNYDKPQEKKYDVIFSGNMSYKPNVLAARYLIKKIMPIVWDRNKDVKVAIVGSNPTKEVKKLENSKVKITGWVEDMRDYYAQSKVFIAPMQIGTGLQNKLLEAMAMGLPCITTPLSNSALKDVSYEYMLIGNDAKELAQHILTLLANDSINRTISKMGNNFVKENYNWQQSTHRLIKLMDNHIKKQQQINNHTNNI